MISGGERPLVRQRHLLHLLNSFLTGPGYAGGGMFAAHTPAWYTRETLVHIHILFPYGGNVLA
jgi:hypothetical protein